MGVYHGFEMNETATMFFLKKPSLVKHCPYYPSNQSKSKK